MSKAVKPVPVINSRQKRVKPNDLRICGICQKPLFRLWKYCPNCGTKIDWEEDKK